MKIFYAFLLLKVRLEIRIIILLESNLESKFCNIMIKTMFFFLNKNSLAFLVFNNFTADFCF